MAVARGISPVHSVMLIPKIIHQTYHSQNFSDEILESVNSLKAMNPDWDYRFYDDAGIEGFIKKNYQPEILGFYRKINPVYGAARADFFRYLLIYKMGGVYLDIKSYSSLPLNNVVYARDRYILTYWPNLPDEPFAGWGGHAELLPAMLRGEFQNWHIIAAPNHPFLHYVVGKVIDNIKNYRPETYGVGTYGVVNTTGPIAYSQAIMPLLTGAPHRLAGSHLDIGLVYNKGGALTHRTQFDKKHYSDLTEPVVLK